MDWMARALKAEAALADAIRERDTAQSVRWNDEVMAESLATACHQRDEAQKSVIAWKHEAEGREVRLANARREALIEAARFLERDGWNDSMTIVNQKTQAFQYAGRIRALAEKQARAGNELPKGVAE